MKDPKNKKPLLKKQMLLILGPTGAAVLVLLVILLARSFAGKGDATTVSNDQPDTLEAESASAQPETQRFSEPVSLTAWPGTARWEKTRPSTIAPASTPTMICTVPPIFSRM